VSESEESYWLNAMDYDLANEEKEKKRAERERLTYEFIARMRHRALEQVDVLFERVEAQIESYKKRWQVVMLELIVMTRRLWDHLSAKNRCAPYENAFPYWNPSEQKWLALKYKRDKRIGWFLETYEKDLPPPTQSIPLKQMKYFPSKQWKRRGR
jgi:hypothetical protein